MHKSHQQEHSTRKTITKLFDRFVNGGAELWNDKEITATLTAPGTIRTAVGGKIRSKIPGKTCVKILIKQVWLS